MDYIDFAKQKPILYGQIVVNGKAKVGSFHPGHNNCTNSITYFYHSPAGNKGKGGFTLNRAYFLLQAGTLSFDPAKGDPKNYL